MWKQEKVEAQVETLRLVKDSVAVSGGLAWHIMSPPHVESKKVHDHSDMDLFVSPLYANDVISRLKTAGFNRCWSKYDGTQGFYRYEKTTLQSMPGESEEKRVKTLIDLFVENVPTINVSEFFVVDPPYLLRMYETKHASKECVAVKAATELIRRHINPVGRPELVGDFLCRP